MRGRLDALGYAIHKVFMDTLAKRIKSSRTLRKMTQITLAEIVGVSTSSISQYESETDMASEPSVKTLEKIARALDVSFEWLATGRGKQDIEEFLVDITEMYKSDDRLVVLTSEQKKVLDVYEILPDDWRDKYLEIGEAVGTYYVDDDDKKEHSLNK